VTIHEELLAASGGERRLQACGSLCRGLSVTLLDVELAAISLVFAAAIPQTLGRADPGAVYYDFITMVEGPCVVNRWHFRAPVLVVDLADPTEGTGPAVRAALLAQRNSVGCTRGRCWCG